MLNNDQIDKVIRLSLEEDMPFGDITTENIIPEESCSSARFIAKEDGILAGMPVVERTFYLIDPRVKLEILCADGSRRTQRRRDRRIEGPTSAILKGERTALNLLQRLSGVATRTQGLARLVADTPAKVVDTR